MQFPCAQVPRELYFQGSEEIIFSREQGGLMIPRGEEGDFFTYFNGFFQESWKRATDIEDFRVRIKAEGDFILSFCHGSRTDRKVHWRGKGEKVFTIPRWNKGPLEACYLKVRGIGKKSLLRDFQIEGIPVYENPVRLGVVICTCHREEEVRETIRRIGENPPSFLPTVFVVDNGNTLGGETFPGFVRYVPNRNCGGTGGFTRGMLEILDQGDAFTHVLLMDDDIVLDPAVLERTIRYLSFLKPEEAVKPLSGSLLYRNTPWLLYESGALWNRGRIFALRHDLDLRKRKSLLINAREGEGDYGGWWYCCFPLERIRNEGLPLPLFLHRDDIEYGLRLGSPLVLNGIGVWHEAFEQKIPGVGEYYDLRNMAILNSLYVKDWTEKEWIGFLRKWTAGKILRGQYEYVPLNIRGALDFLKGPRWLENTDAPALHQEISESLSPLRKFSEIPQREKKGSFITDPGVSVYVAARKRKIIYRDETDMCLTGKKSLQKTVSCLLLLHRTEIKTRKCFERARVSYQTHSREMTRPSFWREYLEMEKK